MEAVRRVGRTVGILILLQMISGGLVNAVLEAPLFGAPGFLVNAAPHATRVGVSVVLALVGEALWLGIAIAALPIFWPRARSLAIWFVALAAVTLAAAVLENAGVMSMLSLSRAYATAGTADAAPFQLVRGVVASTRNWAHYMGRIADGVTMSVFYLALFRIALVPRILSGFGLVAVALMVTSVGMPLFGRDVVFPMLAPVGLSQLLVAVWLLWKGFPPEARAAV